MGKGSNPPFFFGTLMELYDNPSIVFDQRLKLHVYPPNSHRLSTSRTILIDSAFRNATDYPNPSEFRIKLKTPAQGVKAVRPLWIAIPTPTTPTSPYILIVSKALQHIEYAEDTDLDTSTTFAPEVISKIFASVPIENPTPTTTIWRHNHFPQTKIWVPEIERLSVLDFSLRTSTGDLYDTGGDNWSMCIEILSFS